MKKRGQKLMYLLAGGILICLAVWLPVKSSVAQGVLAPAAGILPVMTPYRLVSNLDLACHQVEGGQTPVRSVVINHLNPVLQKMGFKEQRASLGRLEQLCAPVVKNEVFPPKDVMSFVRWIDLACYEAKTEVNESATLKLSHLNPVLRKMGLPSQTVKMARLDQVCVPVAKNGVTPPDNVRRLVEHVDVACYEIYPESQTKPFNLHLTHLNPIFREMGLTEEKIVVETPEHVCVPVAKNGKMPPNEVLQYVQWIDFSKYAAYTPNERKPIPLTLSHLNPQFVNFDRFKIEVLGIDQLAVPVAKNGKLPPDLGDKIPLQ